MSRLDTAYEAIDAFVGPHADDSQLLIRAKCRGLLAGYDARWCDAGYRAIEVEKYYEADLTNPQTMAKSRTFRLGGKIDLVAELNGRTFLIDHKTTSHDILDPNSPYWRQLVIEGQVSHYLLLLWLHGIKVDNAVWDVIKKPGISPKKLSKADRAQVVSLRKYFGYEVSQASIDALIADDRETLELYEYRLAHDCTHERPEAYFQRRAVPRIDAELFEYAQELWGHSKEIMEARKSGRHLRNSGACALYGSFCKFLGLCAGADTIESDRWKHKQQVHNELPIVDSDGRNILTNSRVRCWSTCHRKHFYEYEEGIMKHDDEEREALWFGRLFHLGLNAWWEHGTKKEHYRTSEKANIG